MSSTGTKEGQTGQTSGTLALPTLTGMVVGSMVGAGVFSLPRRFATETGVAGALVAWAIAGTGMLMLALVFQLLAIRKPDLNAGVYAYAKEGFGEYLGFFSAFGYRNAGQCSGLQAGGEGPRGRAAGPERALPGPAQWAWWSRSALSAMGTGTIAAMRRPRLVM